MRETLGPVGEQRVNTGRPVEGRSVSARLPRDVRPRCEAPPQKGDPMFALDLPDGTRTVTFSASDLTVASTCEFHVLRGLDVLLGRAPRVEREPDALLERAADLGEQHERRVLERYRRELGPERVAELPSQTARTHAGLVAAQEATLAALRSGAEVVFQGAFFDGRLVGRSDFLLRRGEAWQVLDTKLARTAKTTALLQLAAYADQLMRLGVPVHPTVGLVLGDDSVPEFPLEELLPVYAHRRARLTALLDTHLDADGPAAWDAGDVSTCGSCDVCREEVQARRDVLLVAGLRRSQRARLRTAGVTTVEELAHSTGPVPGVGAATLERLRSQARLQSRQDHLGPDEHGRPQVLHEVIDQAALLALPAPDPGDLFFDFEGDPLWSPRPGEHGLEYLFGAVEADTGEFVHWLAHDREQERAALVAFLDYLERRRARHPGLHVYHYASYEASALARLSQRHGVGEAAVDNLLSTGVLVDLYAVVRASLRVSQPSYSIKKLEPLYMGEQLRTGVDNAADSVAQYAVWCGLRDAGDDVAAAEVLAEILDYNRYDCVSTRELLSWLRRLDVRGAA